MMGSMSGEECLQSGIETALRCHRSLNFSHFVARQIWRRRGASPLGGRAHHLQRREPLQGLLMPMAPTLDVLQTARN